MLQQGRMVTWFGMGGLVSNIVTRILVLFWQLDLVPDSTPTIIAKGFSFEALDSWNVQGLVLYDRSGCKSTLTSWHKIQGKEINSILIFHLYTKILKKSRGASLNARCQTNHILSRATKAIQFDLVQRNFVQNDKIAQFSVHVLLYCCKCIDLPSLSVAVNSSAIFLS